MFERVLLQGGEEAALAVAAQMKVSKLVDLTEPIAVQAAVTSASLRLPMAGAILLATARRHEATLWTQDGDFEGIDGVQFRARITR